MDESFWLECWHQNEIGFHKEQPHHDLLRFFEKLEVKKKDSILVPLCGKSLDLVWLHDQGLHVVGIELSRLALNAFVDENNLSGEWISASGMPCWKGNRYKLFCGDLFKLTADAPGEIRAVYDRGSLVALPPEMRKDYVKRLAELSPADSRTLIVSYEYDQGETYGPPFSVPMDEIDSLFTDDYTVKLLAEEDALWSHEGLATRGVTKLTEFAVLLTRK